jgi:hypothetical protein
MKHSILKLAIGVAAVSAYLPSALLATCGVDLNTEFTTHLGRQYGQPGNIHQTVNITNNGPTVKGPYYFVVENLPANVGVTPFTWTAACEQGAYFIRIYLGFDNQWQAGATKTLSLTFLGPPSLPVNYNYRVIKGDIFANPRVVPGDHDGDRIADVATFNPSTGNWSIKQSSNTAVTSMQWGVPNLDHHVVGDFDGDLKEDYAVYRPSSGAFFIRRSSA